MIVSSSPSHPWFCLIFSSESTVTCQACVRHVPAHRTSSYCLHTRDRIVSAVSNTFSLHLFTFLIPRAGELLRVRHVSGTCPPTEHHRIVYIPETELFLQCRILSRSIYSRFLSRGRESYSPFTGIFPQSPQDRLGGRKSSADLAGESWSSYIS
jgi:hypothetical protein